MNTIGIIDDREPSRTSITENFEDEVSRDSWNIISVFPLWDLADYPAWITENEIRVLIVDERLHEGQKDGKAVGYQGHDLVSFIRKRMPTLPIFIITAYPPNEALKNRFKEVEDIIARIDFSKNVEGYIHRIVRSAQKFIDTYELQLNELALFAKKAAKGEAITDDELAHINAIREHLSLAFPMESFADVNEVVQEVSKLTSMLEKLRTKLERNTKQK